MTFNTVIPSKDLPRSLLEALFLLYMVIWICLSPSQLHYPVFAIGFVVISVGIILRIWAKGARRMTQELSFNELGPYAYLQQPLAVSMFLIVFGLAIASGQLNLLWWVFVYFFVDHFLLLRQEKALLSQATDPMLLRYRGEVSRYFPQLSPFRLGLDGLGESLGEGLGESDSNESTIRAVPESSTFEKSFLERLKGIDELYLVAYVYLVTGYLIVRAEFPAEFSLQVLTGQISVGLVVGLLIFITRRKLRSRFAK